MELLSKRELRKICRDLGMKRNDFRKTYNEIYKNKEEKSLGKYIMAGSFIGLSMSPFMFATDPPAIVEEKTENEKPQIFDFKLGTVQAGITTNGDVKDRVIAKANVGNVIKYKGLYEAYQRSSSVLDELYMRNEIIATGMGDENITPISVFKVKKEDGKLKLKDAKFGIKNTSIPKKLFGSGKMYLTANSKGVTWLGEYDKKFSNGFYIDITSEVTFKKSKDYAYIEAEVQKYLKNGGNVYLFIRGELENYGAENKLIFGIGANPR